MEIKPLENETELKKTNIYKELCRNVREIQKLLNTERNS